jgi:probable addiction module antidote protein
MPKSKPIADTLNNYLQDPAEASAYLDAVLESGDNSALLVALRDVVDARGGVSELAMAKNLSRETLYRTLAAGGNPTLDTLSKVLEFAGLRVSVLPVQEERAKAS